MFGNGFPVALHVSDMLWPSTLHTVGEIVFISGAIRTTLTSKYAFFVSVPVRSDEAIHVYVPEDIK